ncbi:hypothetical protein ACLKA6_019664 [Drosophila palustris]
MSSPDPSRMSNTISIELNRTNTTSSCNPSIASQRRRQQRAAQHRQESWFRHSMPPAVDRDFESLEHLTHDSTNGLDEQLAASLSGKLPVLSHTSIHLNSANSNLGFIDSDTPNTPVTPQSDSMAGTLSSCQPIGTADNSSRQRSRNRKDSKGSILSSAARGIRMTTSFLRRKRKEYEVELP